MRRFRPEEPGPRNAYSISQRTKARNSDESAIRGRALRFQAGSVSSRLFFQQPSLPNNQDQAVESSASYRSSRDRRQTCCISWPASASARTIPLRIACCGRIAERDKGLRCARVVLRHRHPEPFSVGSYVKTDSQEFSVARVSCIRASGYPTPRSLAIACLTRESSFP